MVVSENVFGLLAWAVIFLVCFFYICKISDAIKIFWVIMGALVIFVIILLLTNNIITDDDTVLFQIIDGELLFPDKDWFR